MNYIRKSGMFVVFLLFLLLSVFAAPGKSVSAASGKTVYSGTWLKKEQSPRYGILSSVKISGNTMIVNGSLAKGAAQNYRSEKGKRKFHLSPKVKFYVTDSEKVSKQEFVKLCRHLNRTANCLRFRFVVKNDKVVKASIIL